MSINVDLMKVLMAIFDRQKNNVPLRSVNRWNVMPQLLTSKFVELSLFTSAAGLLSERSCVAQEGVFGVHSSILYVRYYAVACKSKTECLLCQLILLGSSLLCSSFPLRLHCATMIRFSIYCLQIIKDLPFYETLV